MKIKSEKRFFGVIFIKTSLKKHCKWRNWVSGAKSLGNDQNG